MAINTAGNTATRQDLDALLLQSALTLRDALRLGELLAAKVHALADADLADLDPARPYTPDELYAIKLLADQLSEAITAVTTGQPMAAMATPLAVLAESFTGMR